MKHTGILLSALFLLPATAQAADLAWNGGNSAPTIYSASPVSDWSGFYAGINGGYSWGTTINNPALAGGNVNNNSGGWSLGGQAGYNIDMGGFVLGGEADLHWANIGYSENPAAGKFEAKVDAFGSVRARAGVPFGQVLPYVTAGLAAGHGTASITDAANVTTSQSATHFGWTVGLGLEAKATDNISVKAEYLYVDLGTQSYNGLPVGNRDITQRFSVVRAGLNYKF
ncbi:MAG: porin family protein [Devosia nanyangense]|nr:porin family protein [Devosia nanyangense]CDP53858.1 putative outer-membrane immunogenic protein precur sor [Devosia sp. DBB001]